MTEHWEESFDTWTPRADKPDGETDTDVDRAELLRLARELAAQRNAEQAQARKELEQLKESLRERAEAVAARERELLALQKRLEKGKPPKTKAERRWRTPIRKRSRPASGRRSSGCTRSRRARRA